MKREHQWMWLFMSVGSWYVQQKGAVCRKRVGDIAGLRLLDGGVAQYDLRCPCAACT